MQARPGYANLARRYRRKQLHRRRWRQGTALLAAAGAAFLAWWFLIRTPTGILEVTLRQNPGCQAGHLCARLPRQGKLFLWGPHDHPSSYDPDSDYFHLIDIDWSHPTVRLKLETGHYGIAFLLPPDIALATSRGEGLGVDVRENQTTDVGVLMPSARDRSFPAFGD